MKIKPFFILALYLLFTYCSFNKKEENPVVLEKEANVYLIKSGNYSITVDSNIGARVVSAKFDKKEFLASSEMDSIAYGSTFWPSPYLTKWPPPIDYDQTKWEAKQIKKGLLLTGPIMKNLGLQFKKKIEFQKSDNSFSFEFVIVNRTDSAVWVAPWEVTRLPKGGEFIAPALPSGFNTQKMLDSLENRFEHGGYRCFVPENYRVKSQKISLDASEGWEAYIHEDHLFLKLFENIEAEKFAKKSGDAEFYIDDNSDYVEVESQGAFSAIPPGSSIVYKTKWILRPWVSGCTEPEKLRRMVSEFSL